MSEFKLSTSEEIFEALKEELHRAFPRGKAANTIMDIEFLMESHTKKVLDEVLAEGHGGGNWRRLLLQMRQKFDYE